MCGNNQTSLTSPPSTSSLPHFLRVGMRGKVKDVEGGVNPPLTLYLIPPPLSAHLHLTPIYLVTGTTLCVCFTLTIQLFRITHR